MLLFLFKIFYSLAWRIWMTSSSLFSKEHKWRKWVDARKELDNSNRPLQQGRSVLCYCSSLGEYRSIEYIIEELKSELEGIHIEICLFSDSGYPALSSEGLNVSLSPPDLPNHVAEFFSSRRVDIVIICDNSVWPHLLDYLIAQHIPYFYSSFNIPTLTWRRRLSLKVFKKYLIQATHLWTYSPATLSYLGSAGIANISQGGNPRVQSIFQKSVAQVLDIPGLEKTSKTTVVCGSTHFKDEALIRNVVNQASDVRWIIVPHEVSVKNAERLRQWFPTCSVYPDSSDFSNDVVIIHQTGLLARLYRLADLAYVGGGFDKGIHNILEATVFGKKVIFGPNYHRFQEAFDLIELGTAQSISRADQFVNILKTHHQTPESSQKIEDYLLAHKNASKDIADRIAQVIGMS